MFRKWISEGDSQQQAIKKVQEVITSFEEVHKTEKNVYSAPISIQELHEFLV